MIPVRNSGLRIRGSRAERIIYGSSTLVKVGNVRISVPNRDTSGFETFWLTKLGPTVQGTTHNCPTSYHFLLQIAKSAMRVYLNFLKIYTVETLTNNAHKNLLKVLTMF
jgi:hypothetical protein